MNQNKYYAYGKCTKCNTTVKYQSLFLKMSNNKKINNKLNLFIKILCSNCFIENDYQEIDIDMLSKNTLLLQIVFINNQKIYINKKDFKKHTKNDLLVDQRQIRKQELISRLNNIKLSHKNFKNQMYYQYIATGIPNIETVINCFLEKQNIENERLCILLDELKKNHLKYDNDVPSYKKFIKCGGDLKKIIKNGEIEKILIKETNYLSLLDNTDSDTARDIAIVKASKNTDQFNKYIIKKNTIQFD